MFFSPYPSTQLDPPVELYESDVVVVGPGVVVEVDLDLGDPPGDHPPVQVVPPKLDPRPGHLPSPGHTVRCSEQPLRVQNQSELNHLDAERTYFNHCAAERPEDG